MEEGKREEEFLELVGFLARVVVGFSHLSVCSHQIGFESLWRLVGNFDTVLEDWDREFAAGHGGQPKSVVRMGVRVALSLLNSLQSCHPTHSQMAVLQTYPISISSPRLDHFFGDVSLPLSK